MRTTEPCRVVDRATQNTRLRIIKNSSEGGKLCRWRHGGVTKLSVCSVVVSGAGVEGDDMLCGGGPISDRLWRLWCSMRRNAQLLSIVNV